MCFTHLGQAKPGKTDSYLVVSAKNRVGNINVGKRGKPGEGWEERKVPGMGNQR